MQLHVFNVEKPMQTTTRAPTTTAPQENRVADMHAGPTVQPGHLRAIKPNIVILRNVKRAAQLLRNLVWDLHFVKETYAWTQGGRNATKHQDSVHSMG